MASRAKEARARESQYRVDKANGLYDKARIAARIDPWVFHSPSTGRQILCDGNLSRIRGEAPSGADFVRVSRSSGRIRMMLELISGRIYDCGQAVDVIKS